MRYLQFLDFEICRGCNLANEHAQCPTTSELRYAGLPHTTPMTDEQIIEIAVAAYTVHGFRGFVGWHYYNEPLVAATRMWALMAAIKQRAPQARFLLWTNGELIPEDAAQFGRFDQIWITNYRNQDFSRVAAVCPNTHVKPAALDTRRDMARKDSSAPCVRPFVELIFDYYGNAHICCMDWQGRASPGNIHTSPLEQIVGRMQSLRQSVSGAAMWPDAPPVCRTCALRFGYFSPEFEPAIAREQIMARDYYDVAHVPPGNAAVVFTSYRVPESRLNEHFSWNDAAYRATGVQVYVVADREYVVPDYAHCLVYDQPMPVFNLARTSNFGIRQALNAGHAIIVKTDVDVCFPEHALARFVRCFDDEALVPLYLMAANYDERRWNYVEMATAQGTVALTAANWQALAYDERCVGYGAEDGALMAEISKKQLSVNRDGIVWHIAHVANTPQTNKRTDFWNRDNDFNPQRIEINKRAAGVAERKKGRIRTGKRALK